MESKELSLPTFDNKALKSHLKSCETEELEIIYGDTFQALHNIDTCDIVQLVQHTPYRLSVAINYLTDGQDFVYKNKGREKALDNECNIRFTYTQVLSTIRDELIDVLYRRLRPSTNHYFKGKITSIRARLKSNLNGTELSSISADLEIYLSEAEDYENILWNSEHYLKIATNILKGMRNQIKKSIKTLSSIHKKHGLTKKNGKNT